MPEIVTCPKCGRKLRVPEDLVGKTVKCPECKEAFFAQTDTVSGGGSSGGDAPAQGGRPSQGVSTRRREADTGGGGGGGPLPDLRRPEEEDEDHPSRGYEDFRDSGDGRMTSDVRSGWRTVRLGLSMFIWAIYIGLAAVVVYLLCLALAAILVVVSGASFISALTANSQSSANNAGTAGSTALVIAIVLMVIAYAVALLAGLVQLVLQVTGHVMCLYVPHRPGTGRRPLAIAMISLYGAMLLVPLAGCLFYCVSIGAGSGMRNAGVVMGGVMVYYCGIFAAMLCFIAWFFVHMFFLRGIAHGMRDNSLARLLLIYLICYPTFLVLSFLTVLVVGCVGGVAAASVTANAASSGSSSGGFALGGWFIALIVIELLIFLVNLAMMIWYVILLHQTRGSITRGLRS